MDKISLLGYAYAATDGAEQKRYAAKLRDFISGMDGLPADGQSDQREQIGADLDGLRHAPRGRTWFPPTRKRKLRLGCASWARPS